MLTALRRLYQVVDIPEPPHIDDYWIVIPAEPSLVYLGLQRAVPDWFELFVVPKEEGARAGDGHRLRSSAISRSST